MRSKFPIGIFAALVAGVCLGENVNASEPMQVGFVESTPETTEVQQLRRKLEHSEAVVRMLQENLVAATSEVEIFRRKTSELNVRLEAMGTEPLDTRLIKLLNSLKTVTAQRRTLQQGMMALSESVLRFKQAAVTDDADARLDLESGIRVASEALSSSGVDNPGGQPKAVTSVGGRVISLNEELALVVTDVGAGQGVRSGMPFQVLRGDSVVGSVRIVNVREKISGALIVDESAGDRIRVGDRLKIAAQP